MEAILDFGEICGRQVSGSFVGPRCGNWKGVANVSYEDIIELEDSLTKKVKKINNCCRMELIRYLKKAMSAEYNDLKIDHVFKHIMAIADNKLGFSGKLVESFLCLKVSRESSSDVVTWKNDGGFWSNLLRTGDKITLKDEKVNIPDMYIKLVMDLDKLWKFHWGLHSYDFLLSSIEKARKKLDKSLAALSVQGVAIEKELQTFLMKTSLSLRTP
ncbi:hypothetical protein F2Q69_00023995 [Brassica cretica]|uniref:Uncharacterized protein n=1 Tax=Brassica cretica TaxID=69181 RepID=A0A8S9PZN1_BRACR|nr:hypothetical protein F2Q69_00023995 [Brassica cretica]